MRYQTKLAVLLLAGVSLSCLSARADDAPVLTIRLADASAPASPSEMVSVTPMDPQADSGGSGSTSNVGTIDVQGAGTALGSGYIIQEDGPKGRSTVTHEGINNLLPSANPFQAISILPGVNQFQDDAVGLSGGTIRVRGLVGAQMGFTINGAPVNDSGNFAVYPQEYVDAENLDQIWVTQGSTDIDAPHVGASGGNIGIVTRAPLDYFNVRVEQGAGQLDFTREFVSVDTGWVGNFKGFVSVSQTNVDKWRGDGTDNRLHSDGNLLYQFKPGSSIGLIWLYNDGFDYFYRGYTNSTISGDTALQAFNTLGSNFDYDTFWGSNGYPLHLSGTGANSPSTNIVNPNFPAANKTNQSNYWPLQINPFRNAVVTLPIHLQLSDSVRWETNGYLWWGFGGGGFGSTLTEQGFVNGYQVPVEYGDATGSKNTLLLYKSSVTRTFRPGVTSKLIYDTDNWTFMGGVWYEHANHRQTAPYSLVDPNGHACDAWLTNLNVGNNCVVYGATGAGGRSGPVEGRDFLTDSVGEAVYGEVQGRFMDDALKVNLGLADRDIHRSMYDYLPICGVSATYCGNGANPTLASTLTSSTWLNSSAYRFFGGPTNGSAAAYAAMQQFAANPHANFRGLLPEFNLTYDIDPINQVFAGAMRDYRTPSNFVFNSFNSSTFNATTAQVLEITKVTPEFTWTYEAGYRYHGDFVTASTTLFLNDLTNYQASAQLDPTDFTTVNIGGVKIYGIDAEAGTKPWHHFTFYASATLENSRLSSNLQADTCNDSNAGGCAGYAATTPLLVATHGKQLVDTPNWLISASIGYEQDGVFANLTPHCYGQRATSLLNDEYVPANCTLDAAVGYRFGEGWGYLKDATIQLNVVNLVDSRYIGEITTQAQTNAKTAAAFSPTAPGHAFTVPGQSYTAYPAAPVFVGVKLNVNLGD